MPRRNQLFLETSSVSGGRRRLRHRRVSSNGGLRRGGSYEERTKGKRRKESAIKRIAVPKRFSVAVSRSGSRRRKIGSRQRSQNSRLMEGCWRKKMVTIVVGIVTLMELACPQPILAEAVVESTTPSAAPSNWNASCPAPCHCQLQTSDFTHRLALRTVNCSYQRLKSVPADLPRETEAVLLAGNALGDLYDHIPDLLDLRELDVTDNRLRSLGRGYIFHNLSGMTYLGLAKNELTSLVRDVFSGLVRLQVLILAENKITYIEDQAFHGLTSLQTLDLGRNQLSALYPEWFYGLGRLRELYLYENRIHAINGATFRPLRRLQHLSLHGNRVAHVSDDGLWGLDALDTLHLERNNLQEVPSAAVRRLPSLQMLYLSGNPFGRFRSGDFADYPALVELALNSLTNLRLVEARAFQNLTHLDTLQMRDCHRLAYIDPEAFVNLTVLRHLNLQNDNLQAIPKEVASTLPSGCEISLSGNPLLCDCNVRWLRRALGNSEYMGQADGVPKTSAGNGSRVILAEPEHLVCDAPDSTHGIPLLHLDLPDSGAAAWSGTAHSVLMPQCAPSILPIMDLSIEKRLGDPLSLDCRAVGIPAPRIHWTLPGGQNLGSAPGDGQSTSSFVVTNDIRMQMRKSGTLFFYHVKDDDDGNFTCTADNGVGQPAQVTVQLVVKRIDIQLFPTGISSNFVTVVWNGTARNSFPQFQILYRLAPPVQQLSPTARHSNVDGAWRRSAPGGRGVKTDLSNNGTSQSYEHVTVSPFHRSYTITNLRPESTYEFCIAYQDRDGYYVQISCTIVRTQDADYLLQGIHRTSNVAVAIVLCIVVTMVMVICVVTVAARKYRQRQYICPDKPIIHRMSHIPLENLYSPLMSNAGP